MYLLKESAKHSGCELLPNAINNVEIIDCHTYTTKQNTMIMQNVLFFFLIHFLMHLKPKDWKDILNNLISRPNQSEAASA